MCGIAGVIYKDKKTHPVGEALTSMLESLQHRGPDSVMQSMAVWIFLKIIIN